MGEGHLNPLGNFGNPCLKSMLNIVRLKHLLQCFAELGPQFAYTVTGPLTQPVTLDNERQVSNTTQQIKSLFALKTQASPFPHSPIKGRLLYCLC